jgi:dipeptidyl-peptidase 4
MPLGLSPVAMAECRDMTSTSLPHQLVRTRRFTLGVPERFTITADGASVLFLRSRAGDDPVTCLWALDLDSGTERLLADPAQPPHQASEPTAGIIAYATDRAAGLAAFAMAGGLWTVDVAEGRARRLPVPGPVADPRPDPTGRWGTAGDRDRGRLPRASRRCPSASRRPRRAART